MGLYQWKTGPEMSDWSY